MATSKFSVAIVICFISFLDLAPARVPQLSLTQEYWHQKLPTVVMRVTLQSLVSPLTSAEIKRFAKPGAIASNAAAFCKAAKIVCSEPVGVMPVLSTGRWNRARSETLEDLDLEATTYFHEKDLIPGADLSLNLHNLYPLRPFLPPTLEDAVPFSSEKISDITQILGIPSASGMITNMGHTLEDCDSPEANNEIKMCASSLETMVDFATSLLGTDLNILQTHNSASKIISQKQSFHVVRIPEERPAKSRSVACHNQMYPYMVYYCHQIHDTKVFAVTLRSEDGSVTSAVATCHVNTSNWNPNHVAFKVLKAKPGETDICHFISEDDVVWVPAN